MDEKEKLKKELRLILSISEKYNLCDDRVVKKLNELLKAKNDFSTSLGKKYMAHLLDVENGSSSKNCFICNKEHATDRVICNSCMQKYSGGKMHIFGQEIENIATHIDDKMAKADAETVKEIKQENKVTEQEILKDDGNGETIRVGDIVEKDLKALGFKY
ncbi:MAG: hypothetical protein IK018_01910 [Lachnospiraceae bacterium]|nr:hypothetical protein [Lachnospiraceae bacterium]